MEKTIKITEDYVSFETAKLLKEKGFDIITETAYYIGDNNRPHCKYGDFLGHRPDFRNETSISAPTLQMAMKWLREVHNIFFSVNYFHIDVGNKWLCLTIWLPYKNGCELSIEGLDIETVYEKAIKYCLENLI